MVTQKIEKIRESVKRINQFCNGELTPGEQIFIYGELSLIYMAGEIAVKDGKC